MLNCVCQTEQYQNININDKFYQLLWPGHIIRTLMEEHQVILNFCKALEKSVSEIKKTHSIDDKQEIIAKLRFISAHLLRNERHHIREENTFMRRLVAMSEFEPTQDIRKQHQELWILKRKLEMTVLEVFHSSYSNFLKELPIISNQLINMLRNHIDIENNILFPQAVKMIPDENQWYRMHTEAHNIGYCCFTPGIR